jgi:hypothetical protein
MEFSMDVKWLSMAPTYIRLFPWLQVSPCDKREIKITLKCLRWNCYINLMLKTYEMSDLSLQIFHFTEVSISFYF